MTNKTLEKGNNMTDPSITAAPGGPMSAYDGSILHRAVLEEAIEVAFTEGPFVEVSSPFLGVAFGLMHIMNQVMCSAGDSFEKAKIELASGETLSGKTVIDYCDLVLNIVDRNTREDGTFEKRD
jgi:hypothetical protein